MLVSAQCKAISSGYLTLHSGQVTLATSFSGYCALCLHQSQGHNTLTGLQGHTTCAGCAGHTQGDLGSVAASCGAGHSGSTFRLPLAGLGLGFVAGFAGLAGFAFGLPSFLPAFLVTIEIPPAAMKGISKVIIILLATAPAALQAQVPETMIAASFFQQQFHNSVHQFQCQWHACPCLLLPLM